MNDLISRQAAIDAFLKELTKRERKNLLHTWSTVEVKYFITELLEKLPSVPERKGQWERHYTRPNVYADLLWHCSVCGYKNENSFANVYHKFCPNCGCAMTEGAEDETLD